MTLYDTSVANDTPTSLGNKIHISRLTNKNVSPCNLQKISEKKKLVEYIIHRFPHIISKSQEAHNVYKLDYFFAYF